MQLKEERFPDVDVRFSDLGPGEMEENYEVFS